MDCPRCHHAVVESAISCSVCGFAGNGRSLQIWSNLTYLLAEMASWDIPASHLNPLRQKYTRLLKANEIELGLRLPPPNDAETWALREQRSQLAALQQALLSWQVRGWLDDDVVEIQRLELSAEIQAIDERLEDAPPGLLPTSSPKYVLRRLAEQQAVLHLAHALYQAHLLSEMGWVRISAELNAAIEALEIEAGLRSDVSRPPSPQIEDAIAVEALEKAPKQKRWQRPSLTWDQVWESLLSERTLNALLFLGVILLLASGVSWVVWNWDTFPPLAQIGFLGSMTAAFFGLGWYVRTRMKLEGSGIALTAVAALLIPLDFYAYYISGGFPPGSWPTVWLVASLVCLAVYVVVAYLLQATFFGYLVALAVGSVTLASLNLWHVPVEWWLTAVTGITFCLASVGFGLQHTRRWQFLKAPFGHIALAGSVPTMLVGLSWAVLVGGDSLAFYLSLAASWWLGGLTMLVMIPRLKMQTLVWATAVTFPVALWLTMRPLFFNWQVDMAWFGLGWLLLAPFYFGAAALTRREDDDFGKAAGKTAVIIGALLVVVAALWSWLDPVAAAVVYLLLALGAGAMAWVSQQTRLLWLMSLSFAISAAGWMASRGANPAELALPWALLAIFHMAAAVIGESRLPAKRAGFLAPLYGAAIVLAAAAIVPPLALLDRPLLAYALANWLGINGWLAILAHQENPGLMALLAYRRLRWASAATFHWLVALPLLAWVALVWTMNRPVSYELGLIMLILAWLTMGMAVGLRRLRWSYGLPWQAASLLASAATFALAFYDFDAGWTAWLVAGTAVYFVVAVWAFHSSRYFYVAGLLLPFSWALLWDTTDVAWKYWQTGWGFFPLTYVLAGIWLEKVRGRERPFTQPFYQMAKGIGILVLGASLLQSLFVWDEADLVWTAFAPAWLSLTAFAYAWLLNKVPWAHVSIWLATFAGALVVKTYSHGTGRSAVLIACGAIGYVLAERGLHQLALMPVKYQKLRIDYRRWWLLWKRPLLFAGWVLSVVAIGAALVRNLIWLGGGSVRQSWAIVALLLVTGLYGLSARLFKKVLFVWLASALVVVPWTLAGNLIWGDELAWYGLSWVVLGLGLFGVGALLVRRLGLGKWSWPPQVIAHLLVPAGLLLTIADAGVASVAVGLAILFYFGATAVDRFYRSTTPPSSRFLFPFASLLPVWAVVFCLWLFPNVAVSSLAMVVWLFVLPLLAVGCWAAIWEPEYRWPFYIVAYSVAGMAIALAGEETAVLSLILFLNTGVAVLSVWVFKDALWWYPATVLWPMAVWALLAELRFTEMRWYGWSLIFCAGLYLAGAWLLRKRDLRRYETPLIAMTFVMLFFGLPFCSNDRLDAFVGYGTAILILSLTAVWLRQPFVLSFAVALSVVPYGVVLSWLDVAFENLGLAIWPGIGVALALAVYLDRIWGVEPRPEHLKLSSSFPWKQVSRWPLAVWERWTRWWALSLYVLAIGFVGFSGLISVEDAGRWLVVMVGGTAVFLWLTYRFRLRGWLLAAGVYGQFATLAFIRLIGFTDSGAQLALAFMPVVWFTFFMGFLVEQGLMEKPLFYRENGRWHMAFSGWSLPFYLLLYIDLIIGQLLTFDLDWESAVVTLLNAVIVGLLATHWRTKFLSTIAALLGLLALMQWLAWLDIADTVWPTTLALLALVYGGVGYGLRRWRREEVGVPRWVDVWERPFILVGWFVSFLALLNGFILSVDIFTHLPALLFFGGSLVSHELQAATMLVRTFALLGLFYLTAALVERRPRLSYLALLLLFASWSMWLLLIQNARELQLYAVPAGAYLLLMGWLEWQNGSRAIARWLDWLGVLILYGSAFWQSFGAHGELYALLMIVEGLLIAWLGSLRRLRRLLYLGVTGVITAVVGQLIEPLLALNTFVLLLLGAGLVGLGIALERRLDKVRELSHELRTKMEHWE
ncbi:MAG: hypothetical protein IAF02_10095 [Anaerolineae bacterium]|nr:hypothetical protein [Anaerolineae bacterium]